MQTVWWKRFVNSTDPRQDTWELLWHRPAFVDASPCPFGRTFWRTAGFCSTGRRLLRAGSCAGSTCCPRTGLLRRCRGRPRCEAWSCTRWSNCCRCKFLSVWSTTCRRRSSGRRKWRSCSCLKRHLDYWWQWFNETGSLLPPVSQPLVGVTVHDGGVQVPVDSGVLGCECQRLLAAVLCRVSLVGLHHVSCAKRERRKSINKDIEMKEWGVDGVWVAWPISVQMVSMTSIPRCT